MKHLIRLTGVFLLLFLILSCEKEDSGGIKPGYIDYMPAETTVGANSFGCYINGEIAAAQGIYQKKGISGFIELPYVNGFWDRYKSYAMIPGTWMSKDTIVTEMRLGFGSKYYDMQITLESTPVRGMNACIFDLDCDTLRNQSGKRKDSSVEITWFDAKKQIICGRFDNVDFHFKDFTVHITKGQFDVNYGTNFRLP